MADLGLGRMRLVAALTVVAFALGAAACGSDDDAGGGSDDGATEVDAGRAERQIAAAYEGYIDALRARRWREACAAYARDYAKAYPGQIGLADTCVGTVRAEYGPLEELRPPRVVDVRVDGPAKGIVFVRARTDGNTTPLAVVKEDGRWRLAGLDGSATEYGTSNDPYAK